MLLADTAPSLPPNAPIWATILLGAFGVLSAVIPALWPGVLNWLKERRRQRRHRKRERLIAALREEGEPVPNTPHEPTHLPEKVDASMALVSQMVAELTDRVKRLEEDNRRLQKRLDDVEEIAADRQAELVELRAENKALRKDNDSLRSQLDAMTTLQQRRSRSP